MLQILVKLGTAAQAIAGGKLLVEGVEEATGVPVAAAAKAFVRAGFADIRSIVRGTGSLLVEGVEGTADTVASVLDPLHIFTDDPAQQRDEVIAQKHREMKKKKAAQKAAKKAQAAAADAEKRAGQLEAEVAAERSRADTLEKQMAAQQKSLRARNMRRIATTARTVASQATAAAAQPSAAPGVDPQKLAEQALAIAQAALTAPTSARDVLRDPTIPDDQKAVVHDFYDQITREQEPDYQRLSDLITRASAGDDSDASADAAADLMDELEGPERKKAPAAPKAAAKSCDTCGPSCGCDSCQAEHHGHEHDHGEPSATADWLVEGGVEGAGIPEQRDVYGADYRGWEGADEALERAGGMGGSLPSADDCPTGTCWVNRR